MNHNKYSSSKNNKKISYSYIVKQTAQNLSDKNIRDRKCHHDSVETVKHSNKKSHYGNVLHKLNREFKKCEIDYKSSNDDTTTQSSCDNDNDYDKCHESSDYDSCKSSSDCCDDDKCDNSSSFQYCGYSDCSECDTKCK